MLESERECEAESKIEIDEISKIISSAKNLPYTYSSNSPKCQAKLRKQNSDFQVEEVLSFKLTGNGEHLFVQIEKDGTNTDWVIRQLAKKTGLSRKDIGYAGKKDRHSLSTQWFSLHLPGKAKEIDTHEFIESLSDDGYTVIQFERHNKKLRVGSILKNNFTIILSDVIGEIDEIRFEKVKAFGFANYFGYQRFGIDFNNLHLAQKIFSNGLKIKNRNKRAMVLSSARSFLFNQQLSERVRRECWNNEVEGDCFMLNNTRSYFSAVENDNHHTDSSSNKGSISERLKNADIHICGWLAGKQVSEAQSLAKTIEDESMCGMDGWIDGLKSLNLDSSRRAYRVKATDLSWNKKGSSLSFTFSLPSGSYATSLLRELVDFVDVTQNKKIDK